MQRVALGAVILNCRQAQLLAGVEAQKCVKSYQDIYVINQKVERFGLHLEEKPCSNILKRRHQTTQDAL